MEKHYTLLKAAELLGVTTQTLRNWDNAGKILAVRTPGNQRRIPESEIVRLQSPKDSDIAKTTQKPQRIAADIQEESEISKESTVVLPTSALKSNDNFLLMCKDTEVYVIAQDLVLDESLLPGCMLEKIMSFSQWMETRYSKDTNFSSQRLMQSTFGEYDNEHAAFATHALSLSDCYWLKREDEDIQYMDISPYKTFDPLANLFVSGKRDKRWIDAQTLLKVNSFTEIEPFTLCAALGLENMAETRTTDEGIILNNFTSPDVFYESMEQFGIEGENANLRDIAIEYFKELAVALFVIDYLVENNDRHPDDYGFLRSSTTGEYMSMAPYYNFDWIWSGEAVALPETAWQGYSAYIHDLCRHAISVAKDFEYGTIIERRANELLQTLQTR